MSDSFFLRDLTFQKYDLCLPHKGRSLMLIKGAQFQKFKRGLCLD